MRTTSKHVSVIVLAATLTVSIALGTWAQENEIRHFVAAEKNLSEIWVRSLFERGEKSVYIGSDLDAIGMPVSGIGTGQLYLCGDGTLGNWEIFNTYRFYGVGQKSYEHRVPDKPVEQGFAVLVKTGPEWSGRRLNKADFPSVSFRGEYPIGTVLYEDEAFPVSIAMEAFSPFIPLNEKDSALPATIFNVTVRNRSKNTVTANLLSWIENPVGLNSGATKLGGTRITEIAQDEVATYIVHTAAPLPETEPPVDLRPTMVMADFEEDHYGDWNAEGNAMGAGPANDQTVSEFKFEGYLGQGFVNSMAGGMETVGSLTSPVFTIERRYVNFLIGGRRIPDKISVNLVVDGEIVRKANAADTLLMAWHSWAVSEFEGQQAQIAIVDNDENRFGVIAVDNFEQADEPREGAAILFEEQGDFGSIALAVTGEAASKRLFEEVRNAVPGSFDGFHFEPPAPWPLSERRTAATLTQPVRLAPDAEHTFTAVMAWSFPNTPGGHEYTSRFEDAVEVAEYVFENQDRLAGDTRLWRDTYYDSTLPYWLLDRLHAPIACLATGTSQWWRDGRFWAYEGVVCCPGTCTHVWNYAHGHARLFPALARSAREMQDFNPTDSGGGFNSETGLVGFRSNAAYAADGQCGTVLKSYREHLMSTDNAFLRKNWPRIRKALEFLIEHDGDADGLIEDSQHNTYDINFQGANTFVGSLYLAALRAGAAMARESGDDALAERWEQIAESGRRLTVERLWNGEYFVQDVDLEQFPKHQYGQGCLSDQLFGQGWAHQLGLGYIYPESHVNKALQAVWKYNWAPDVGPQQQNVGPGRPYARPGQAGLFTCTWPKTSYLAEPVLYHNEVWTGIEYQVAGHMVWEGMVREGLSLCRAVHDRYHPSITNPYNEVECGDHYARAMASWGVFASLAGYEYHGPNGRLAFGPRLTPANFQAAFTSAEGWGTFSQSRQNGTQKNEIRLRWGKLRLRTIDFALAAGQDISRVALTVNNRPVDVSKEVQNNRLSLFLETELVLDAGDVLQAEIQ